jgi:hypothetical protein
MSAMASEIRVISQLPIHNSLMTSLYKNRSVILQFLLEEFLFAGAEIEKLISLLDRADFALSKKLTSTFVALAGSVQEGFSCLAWNQEQGILVKLKHYASTFIASSDHRLSKYIYLEKLSTLLWKTSLDILYILNQLDQKKQNTLKQKEALKKKVQNFISIFKKLSLIVTDCIRDFPSDENLVFFLLRNNTKFERIYGMGYVRKLLLEMYPEGISQAAIVLRDKFIKRGFETIAERFSAKYRELNS